MKSGVITEWLIRGKLISYCGIQDSILGTDCILRDLPAGIDVGKKDTLEKYVSRQKGSAQAAWIQLSFVYLTLSSDLECVRFIEYNSDNLFVFKSGQGLMLCFFAQQLFRSRFWKHLLQLTLHSIDLKGPSMLPHLSFGVKTPQSSPDLFCTHPPSITYGRYTGSVGLGQIAHITCFTGHGGGQFRQFKQHKSWTVYTVKQFKQGRHNTLKQKELFSSKSDRSQWNNKTLTGTVHRSKKVDIHNRPAWHICLQGRSHGSQSKILSQLRQTVQLTAAIQLHFATGTSAIFGDKKAQWQLGGEWHPKAFGDGGMGDM